MSAEYQMSLPLQTIETAPEEAKASLQKAQQKLGFVPNMYGAMANSPGVLRTYLDGYARFREESGFTPAEQETVFLTISRRNGCSYCMAAHSMLAERVSQVPAEALAAIRAGRSIPDPRLDALAKFTDRMVETRGLPSQSDVQAFLDAGFEERHVLEVILAIAVKTLSNYSNHLFHTPIDEVFAGHAVEPA